MALTAPIEGKSMSQTKAERRFYRSDEIGARDIVDGVDYSLARLYIRKGGSVKVEHFQPGQIPNCYQSWLSLPRGVLAAMRNASDRTPVYSHDYVDVH